MLDAKLFCKVSNFFALERWAIVTFDDLGMPCLEKTVSRREIIVFAEMVDTISTSGNLLYSSIMTIAYSPEGNGPAKSIAIFVQGAGGSGVGHRGSRGERPVYDAWHGMQDLTTSSTCLSIPGNQTFSLISCLVFTMPWCD